MIECALHESIGALVTLIDFEVFRTNVEDFLLALGEVKTVRIDGLAIVSAAHWGLIRGGLCSILDFLGDAEERELVGVNEHSGPPVAHLAIVTDADNLVLVVVANH